MDHSHLSHIVPPPPDVQPVVDRMAMYVAKNGVEFEIVVKSKKDPRFDFLHSWHVHFAYYDFKKQLFIQVIIQMFDYNYFPPNQAIKMVKPKNLPKYIFTIKVFMMFIPKVPH